MVRSIRREQTPCERGYIHDAHPVHDEVSPARGAFFNTLLVMIQPAGSFSTRQIVSGPSSTLLSPAFAPGSRDTLPHEVLVNYGKPATQVRALSNNQNQSSMASSIPSTTSPTIGISLRISAAVPPSFLPTATVKFHASTPASSTTGK